MNNIPGRQVNNIAELKRDDFLIIKGNYKGYDENAVYVVKSVNDKENYCDIHTKEGFAVLYVLNGEVTKHENWRLFANTRPIFQSEINTHIAVFKTNLTVPNPSPLPPLTTQSIP
ncbi:hypothetical protein [Nostoc piscinale]|uniref:hypothetical protein n=1 Tax=Nostoc piscinale TaxID=224012 RepID=UPI001187327B|nr:hypothetical protein [Nostoc piscinale]